MVGTADIVAIEEGQFRDPDLPAVVERLAETGKQVLVTGLDQDYRNPSTDASAHGAGRPGHRPTAICMVCGDTATRTQRLIDGQPAPADSPLIMVGGMGDERDEARCRLHHEVLAIEQVNSGARPHR